MALPVDITVVLPTRNRAAQLSTCLSSLVTQTTDARFEVIVVDNASEDTTAEVVRGRAQEDPRIRWVEEPVIGLSRAKNSGIRSARGELLLFTDDDVVLADRWIAAYVDFFRTPRSSPALAGGPVLPVPHDLSPWPGWITASGTVELPRLYHGETARRLGEFEWLWGGNMAAPKRLFEVMGGFDESIGVSGEERGTFEDVELVQRVAANGGESWYVPAAVLYHRTAPEATRPRALAAKAFNRGANDVLRDRRGSHYEQSSPVPRTPLLGAIATPLMLAAWTVSAAVFRVTGSVGVFELARRWAWAAGWCTVTATDPLTRPAARAGRRLALLGRGLAIRLTPP